MRTWTCIRSGGSLALLVLTGWFVAQFHAESLKIEKRRPIEEALDSLRLSHGLAVSYEDPKYEYSADLVDVTAETRNPDSPRRVLMPASGEVTITYDLTNKGEIADPAGAVRDMLNRSNATGERGQFELSVVRERLVVLPTKFRDVEGRLVRQALPLDTRINLSLEDVDGAEILAKIRVQVGERIGIPVYGGWHKQFPRMQSFEVVDMPAREAIAKLLDLSDRNLVWYMLHDPTTKAYYLNMLNVPAISRSLPSQSTPRASPQQ
jgi:hypothetical protein